MSPLFGKVKLWRKVISGLMAIIFAPGPVGISYAQTVPMSTPGTMASLSASFVPPLLKGVKVYPDNPFRLDFILDKGNTSDSADQLTSESTRLIKYFLASITVPDDDLWVNLSPYEKDRIVPDAFGVTEMGRDLLAQDYMLKQITASVIYPEGEIGKAFWAKVYAEAQKRYGTSDVPVDTFNKVWIVPEKAVVYESKDSAYVVESRLKVMLEEDYLALDKNTAARNQGTPSTSKLGSDIVREVVIPILEKEVNEGKNFAQLRQVYHSLILAVWYKDKVRESILGKAYVDRNKTGGVDIEDKAEKEKIWARYVEAFKKGAYNYIKEDIDPATQQPVPRKYFSGGLRLNVRAVKRSAPRSMVPRSLDHAEIIKAEFDPAMTDASSVVEESQSLHELKIIGQLHREIEQLQQSQGEKAAALTLFDERVKEIKKHALIAKDIFALFEKGFFGLADLPMIMDVIAAAGPMALAVLTPPGSVLTKEQLIELLHDPGSAFANMVATLEDDGYGTIQRLGIVSLVAMNTTAKATAREHLLQICQNKDLSLKRFYAYVFALAAGIVDRNTVEQEAVKEADPVITSQFLWRSSPAVTGRISSKSPWNIDQPELDPDQRDNMVKSMLLLTLLGMARKNSALRDTNVVLAEGANIIYLAKHIEAAVSTVAYADYGFTTRILEHSGAFTFSILAHEIGHRLRFRQSLPIASRAWEEYYADFQWWGFAADVVQDRGGMHEYFVEKHSNYPNSFAIGASDPQGIMRDTYGLGMLEHVASRARQYSLRHSVSEVSDVEKNALLQEIIDATVKLQRNISFRVGADIHQELCELVALGTRPTKAMILSMVSKARLYEEENAGHVQADAQVFSSKQVKILSQKGGDPRPVKFGVSVHDSDLDVEQGAARSPGKTINDSVQSGGIDLTRDKMGLQVQSGGQGVQFQFHPAMIQQLQNASGLTPVIIDIQPMTVSVPMFLGINDEHIARK